VIMVRAVQPHPHPRALAFTEHGKARGATIRAKLINIAARPARSGRDQITWRLPVDLPWADGWLALFHATNRRPTRAADTHQPPRGARPESTRKAGQTGSRSVPISRRATQRSTPCQKMINPIHPVDPGSESVLKTAAWAGPATGRSTAAAKSSRKMHKGSD
jgi:hypothetical protein